MRNFFSSAFNFVANSVAISTIVLFCCFAVVVILETILEVMGQDEKRQDEFIGDRSCLYNAQSIYVRCAVNPLGACYGCKHYERRF